jgi:hypothetical protein
MHDQHLEVVAAPPEYEQRRAGPRQWKPAMW